MSKPINLDFGNKLVIFDGDEDLSWVYEIQENSDRNKLVYVARRGTKDRYLYPDRFLVENYDVDMEAHFMYNDKFNEEDRTEYLIEKALAFVNEGRRLFIEDYAFSRPLEFFDYTKR
jgi:hypothetical protein